MLFDNNKIIFEDCKYIFKEIIDSLFYYYKKYEDIVGFFVVMGFLNRDIKFKRENLKYVVFISLYRRKDFFF